MLAGNWFGKKRLSLRSAKSHQPLTKGRRRREAAGGRALRVEELEERRLLATYIVNNFGDLDEDEEVVVGSLRQAIDLSNASEDEDDTIVFADFLFTDPATRQTNPGSIILDGRENGRELSITDNVRILGPGPDTLSIIPASDFRIFNINIDSDEEVQPVTIGGVTLAGGSLTGTNDDDENRGGAILNREGLTLIETVVVGNFASWGGGAVYSPIGSVDVTRSLVMQNTSGGGGGAIIIGEGDDELRPNLTVTDSTFTENSTFGQFEKPGYGGAIYNFSGDVSIAQSTFVGNNASAGGGGVATYGLEDIEDDVIPITTSLSHSILFGNTGAGGADDVFAVRNDLEGAPLAPTLLLDGGGLGYNFIGQIGGATWWDPADGGNGHFYQVVATGEDEEDTEGISWTIADGFTSFGQPPYDPDAELFAGGHLAVLTSIRENGFVFELTTDPLLWSEFQPEDIGDPPAPPPLQSIGPWLGARQVNPTEDVEPAGLWQWLSDPVDVFDDFAVWAPGQPDNGANLVEPEEEPVPQNFLSFFSEAGPTATWGDQADEPDGEGATPIGYVIEFDQGTNFFGVNPLLLPLDDYGGATLSFHPNVAASSPVVDAGNAVQSNFEQRGRHFRRVDGASVDIGAVEVQGGIFNVDTLFDETDGQYSFLFETDGFFTRVDPTYTSLGDFSLREALEFSENNPPVDTITFDSSLLSLEDPTASPAATILLQLTSPSDVNSALVVDHSVNIVGPTGFELELDTVGTDLTPTINNSDGTRLFNVDDGRDSIESLVSISGLTLLGGDVVGTGGAIVNREDLTLSSLNIKENYASSGGGGVSTADSQLTILDSALTHNLAGSRGGAILIQADAASASIPAARVSNSTISGNLSVFGGGILNDNGELLVEFSTITDNTGPIGAGIANVNAADTFTQLGSSIVSVNNGDDIRILGGAVTNVQSLGFNLIGNGNALAVFIQPGDQPGVLDPMISGLVLEGGFTPVHRLLPGSPAIDAGESTAVAGEGLVPMYDQRGNPFTRVFDGVQDTKDRIDIGAYELQGTTFVVNSPIDENDGNISAGNLSLREAVELSNDNPLTDTIMFDAALMQGRTIFQSFKSSSQLQPGTPTDIRITDSVNIIGLGEELLTVDGSNAFTDPTMVPPFGDPLPRSRFFTIDDGNSLNDIQVNISGLTFTNSVEITDVGATIKSVENLVLQDLTFINNSTLGDGRNGGAVYQRYGSLMLDGVTLTANSTDGVDADGGAVSVRDADLTVMNSSISGNSTTQTQGSGGGIYIRGGTLNMSYTSVSANLAPGGEADGGGVFGYQSVLNINNSYITSNSMTGSNSQGAGIFAKDSDLTLTDSFVSLNRTTGTQSYGGGIYLNGGAATLQQSTISFNATEGLTAAGGGIAIVGGELEVLQSTLDRNSTSGMNAPGGSIHNLGGDVTIRDSTISGSTAGGLGSPGGAVFNSTTLGGSEKTLIVNSTISGNSSYVSGGGVYNAGGLTEIRHSTVSNNSVRFLGKGGGVASYSDGDVLTRVYSSIIAGNLTSEDPANPNSDVDAPGISNQNSFVSLGYNVIGTGLPLALDAFNQIGDQPNITDPKLGILLVNGGLTSTHRLLQNSPAVNAGNPADLPGSGNVPANDQRGTGFTRLLGGRIDVGAIESPFAPELSADFDSDGDVDGADFLAWQRGFGTLAAVKSDGDANDDSNVNSVDLGMWESSFGTGTGALAALSSSASSDEQVAFAQAVGESAAELDSTIGGEPLVASAVLASSDDLVGPNSLLTGLTLDFFSAGGGGQSKVVEADAAAEQGEVAADAVDQLFAAFSTQQSFESLLADSPRGKSGDGESSDGTTGNEELELTVEEHFFALLGA